MPSVDTTQRTFQTAPQPYQEMMQETQLYIPTVGVTDYFALRLARRDLSVQPNWSGFADATRQLEIEEPMAVTLGLDPKDDDADAEVELGHDPKYNHWSNVADDQFTYDLLVHIDPTPTNAELSYKKANIAVWMAMLIGKDLQTENGLDVMLERFKSDKSRGKIASWLAHFGVTGANTAIQSSGLSPTLHIASWAGFGVSLVGTSIYRARVGKLVEKLEDNPKRLVELIDEDYTEEAASRFADSSQSLIDYRSLGD